MDDISIQVNNLLNLAKEKKKSDVLDLLSSDEFNKSFKLVKSVLDKLDLDVVEKDNDNFNYAKNINLKISRALARNFFTVYYVNLETDDYIGYSSCEDYNQLKIQEKGTDFFKDLYNNSFNVIYPEDREFVVKSLTKRNLIQETKNGNSFSITYRLMLNNRPTYVSLKAIKVSDSESNLIIGISNVDEQKRKEIKYKQALEENLTYSNIAISLLTNYKVIYYVNFVNSNYIEYEVDANTQTLIQKGKGKHFFANLLVSARRYIHPDDQKLFMDSLHRNNITNEFETNKSFTIKYRQLFDNEYKYMSLIAMNMLNDNDHIILAVSDIDNQVKKESEIKNKLQKEHNLARTDSLTGALNRISYSEIESNVDERISNNEIDELAIVVCDLNNLKIINDTLGHSEGNNYLIRAKNFLSSTFEHSPIYRIGGDEFAIILEEKDYDVCDDLIDIINKKNLNNIKQNSKFVVSIGMAKYNKDIKCLNDLFKIADKSMYDNKKYLKELAQKNNAE